MRKPFFDAHRHLISFRLDGIDFVTLALERDCHVTVCCTPPVTLELSENVRRCMPPHKLCGRIHVQLQLFLRGLVAMTSQLSPPAAASWRHRRLEQSHGAAAPSGPESPPGGRSGSYRVSVARYEAAAYHTYHSQTDMGKGGPSEYEL